jgi:hypothetical protein
MMGDNEGLARCRWTVERERESKTAETKENRAFCDKE